MEITKVIEYAYSYAEYQVSDGHNEIRCICDSVPLPGGMVPKVGMKVKRLFVFFFDAPVIKKAEKRECEIIKTEERGFQYRLTGYLTDKKESLMRINDFIVSLEFLYPDGMEDMGEWKEGDFVTIIADRIHCELDISSISDQPFRSETLDTASNEMSEKRKHEQAALSLLLDSLAYKELCRVCREQDLTVDVSVYDTPDGTSGIALAIKDRLGRIPYEEDEPMCQLCLTSTLTFVRRGVTRFNPIKPDEFFWPHIPELTEIIRTQKYFFGEDRGVGIESFYLNITMRPDCQTDDLPVIFCEIAGDTRIVSVSYSLFSFFEGLRAVYEFIERHAGDVLEVETLKNKIDLGGDFLDFFARIYPIYRPKLEAFYQEYGLLLVASGTASFRFGRKNRKQIKRLGQKVDDQPGPSADRTAAP